MGKRRWSILVLTASLSLTACGDDDDNNGPAGPNNNGFAANSAPQHRLGDADRGRDVFRFETFGNEAFWTDAVRLQQGIVAEQVTPRQALALGLSVDADALDPALRDQIEMELTLDPTGTTSPTLNDPDNTVVLVNANAIIGIVPKDSNGDGEIDVANGDKTGASCALCHTITDGSVFGGQNPTSGGSIGSRQDGRAVHNLDFASLLAVAQNSRAYYPVLQLKLAANGDKTIGRAGHPGLTEDSTEAQVDAFLRDKDSYPVGMFDDTVDGNGDPMHNTPLFRQDLAFPFGSDGGIGVLDNFSNLVFTVLFDPTTLTTPGGRAFLMKLGGEAAGTEIADDYEAVLAATDVTDYPFVQATAADDALAGTEAAPVGLRVDDGRLTDLNAFLFALPAPQGETSDEGDDPAAVERGAALFAQSGCTGCHNADQSQPVPGGIIDMATIFPGDDPEVLLAERESPLNPILNTPDNIFDDKMAVVNASLRGLERGIALPLLLDLARKPVFLHDNSVPDLNALLDSERGELAPHPFFVDDAEQRADLIAFLNSLDTGN